MARLLDRRRVMFLLVVALISVGVWWLAQSRRRPDIVTNRPDHAQPIPVLVTAATRADVPIWLDGLGTVVAFNNVTIHSMIDGPLVDVLFAEGDEVQAGAVLAHIDPRPWQAALDQAVARKAQDEALLANARLDEARYGKLVAQNFISAQTADTARATVAQLAAQVRGDQAQIDTARTNLSYTTITSPNAGRLGIRQIDVGNIIHAADPSGLVVVTQLRPILVIFTLPQQTLPQVAATIAAGPVEVIALPQLAGGPGAAPLDQGSVTALDNQVDSSTGTIRIKATFPNEKLLLWPGGFVNVRIRVRTLHDAVTVPPGAVQTGPAGPYAFVVTAGHARRRPVRVAYQDQTIVAIERGIDAGEQVVTDGASRLDDASPVQIEQPIGDERGDATSRERRAPGAQDGPAAPAD